MARLLILTLSSGEAALPVMTRQLESQSFRDFEHEIISGLPNQAAHNHLYRTVMARASSFDLFLKLDADMTFRSETSLAEAVRATDDHPHQQHFAFTIWDCFTEEETLGVHIFRSGVSWGEITDDLFVDPDPPNAVQILWDGPPAPFVNHGEVVSDFECFAFGVHKFLKAAQRGRAGEVRSRKAHKFFRHMRNCARIRDLYRGTRARRHQLALAGVMWAMEHDTVSAMANKSELQEIFAREVLGQEARWCRRVDRLSHNLLVWRLALLRTLGPRRAFA
ncbi:MAG TPA: hypothetical protein VJ813_04205 [Vicinamibacterales bacterium]|nr:hypothetical protein [Vicinamibacterales bacterium]